MCSPFFLFIRDLQKRIECGIVKETIHMGEVYHEKRIIF